MTVTDSMRKTYQWAEYLLERALAVAELFFLVRFFLKALGANQTTFVVAKLYGFTDALVWPFAGIFPNTNWLGYPIDVVAISAMVGYGLLVLLVLQILRVLARE